MSGPVDPAGIVAASQALVTVRYFAAAAEAASRSSESLAVATVGELRALLLERYGEPMARVLRAGTFLVDGVSTRDDAVALTGTVDVLPPFSGG